MRKACRRCGGEGTVENDDGGDMNCPICGGSGNEPGEQND